MAATSAVPSRPARCARRARRARRGGQARERGSGREIRWKKACREVGYSKHVGVDLGDVTTVRTFEGQSFLPCCGTEASELYPAANSPLGSGCEVDFELVQVRALI